jgi:hypothetical protein
LAPGVEPTPRTASAKADGGRAMVDVRSLGDSWGPLLIQNSFA